MLYYEEWRVTDVHFVFRCVVLAAGYVEGFYEFINATKILPHSLLPVPRNETQNAHQ